MGTVADILHGPVTLWKAPVGEALPADTVAVDDAWGGNWAAFGFTKAPLTSNYNATYFDCEVQEELTPVKRWKSAEALTLATTLAELTPANMGIATSGTATITAQAIGIPGHDDLSVGGESVVDEFAWGFEGTYTDSTGTAFPVRLFIYKGTARITGEQVHGKEDYPGIPIEITALVDTSKAMGSKLFKFMRVTSAAL